MINRTYKLLVIALVLLASSCKAQYPDLEDGLYAEIVTNKGTMVAKLFHDQVPVTVANFVALAEGVHPKVSEEYQGKPYYDGLTFHRVMNDFMIQGGDPSASGGGSPGYTFADELVPELKHSKGGILAMANPGFNGNGSQFYITEKATPWLDGFDANGDLKSCRQSRTYCHSVFGELVKGIEVQDSISNVEVNKGNNKPLEDVIIEKLTIIRKGSEAKSFDAVSVFTEGEPNLMTNYEALEKAQQEKIKLAAAESAKAFLDANKDFKGEVKEFPSGMIMLLDEAASGTKPTSQQRALIDCAGYFESGDLFYTTMIDVAKANNQYSEQAEQAGAYKPFGMPYNESASLVPGFREAMLNMKIGDKARVFIPSFLGYGASGRPPRIPPNTNLVFDIELVGIE